ncbi:MAG TPA: phospholipase D-like domain-containing protein [Gemmatimonadaceae bacterium]|nr:phospholipase D-like domain-containing protein [Gemmatimonadaceae bacterium]
MSTEIVPAPLSPDLPERSSPGPGFARGLWRIAAADVSAGNRVQLLHDGPAAFDVMIEAIEQARETVDLESYIFRHDEVGQRFADALLSAAKRGVAVRVLVDWLGVRSTRRSFFRALREGGVVVSIFNPPGLRPWLGLVPRDHRKLLVVDAGTGVTGGMGLGDEWRTGVHRKRRSRWRDTAVRIEGPAGLHMARAFDMMWNRSIHGERRGSHRMLARPARGSHLDPINAPPALVGIIEGEPLRFRVARALQMQAVSAQRSIWIANAYFVPSHAEVEALTGAARDGVDVRILVPSRNDHPWVTLMTRRYYRRLLMNGVRIWEWQGEMMHAKTSVVDGRWVRVGSTDFNPLGMALNFELDAVIEDRQLGLDAEAMFLTDLERSKQVVL